MQKLLRWPILWWLRFWAKLALLVIKPTIIGVTGSAGKTSARDAIALVSQLKFKKVKVSEKANSESGIPADILGLHFTNYSLLDWIRICLLVPFRTFAFYILNFKFSYDCYVVELGVDEPLPPKNMGYLLTILKPRVGVILNALPVHALQFGKQLGIKNQNELIKAIAFEKGKLIRENSALQIAILNADQPEIKNLGQNGNLIYFGKSNNSQVKIISIETTLSFTKFTFQYNEKNYLIQLDNLVLPEFYAYTLAAAFAVGVALKINPQEITKTLSQNFILPPSRGQILKGINKSIIIDSSYNASRQPVIGSLELLKKISENKIKIAVLGDMRELGKQAKIEHQLVAKKIIETTDRTILVGPLMKKYVLPILEQNGFRAKWFATAGQTATYLKNNLPKNSLVLVKGSQNKIFLEIVVEALLSNKEDKNLLCRRGKFWNKQRKNYL